MVIEQENICNILWQRLHYIRSSSSSSSSLPISQFGFVPPPGQPDLQSRAGSWVWGSAEKAAHEGQVLSGLPHECHGPGAGKGSCGQNLWEKAHQRPTHPRGEYNISTPASPCDRLSPVCCILSKRPSASRHFNKIDYSNHTEFKSNRNIFVLNFKFPLLRCCLWMRTPFLPCDPLLSTCNSRWQIKAIFWLKSNRNSHLNWCSFSKFSSPRCWLSPVSLVIHPALISCWYCRVTHTLDTMPQPLSSVVIH